MTARSIGKFLPSLKLRLGTKAVISAILLIAVNTALVVGAAHWSLTNEFGDRAMRDIEINLRTLSLAFAETYSDAKITIKDGAVARAEMPKMPEFKDHAIVDRAVGYTGGNATLFVYDEASNQFVRRTTNVKKENGDRAVGTQLAPDHPGQAVVRRGEAYKGPATLFGKTLHDGLLPDREPGRKGDRASLRRYPDGAVRDHAVARHHEHGHCGRRRRAAGDAADHGAGAPRDQAADLGHGLADRDRQRQSRSRDRLPRANGRDRRDRANAGRLQEQLGRTPPPARRTDRGCGCLCRAAQIRTARLRRRVPDQRRHHPRQGASTPPANSSASRGNSPKPRGPPPACRASRRAHRKPHPSMSAPRRPRPTNSPARLRKSPAGSRSRTGSRPMPSSRRSPPTSASTNCRKPAPGSATW